MDCLLLSVTTVIISITPEPSSHLAQCIIFELSISPNQESKLSANSIMSRCYPYKVQ